MRIQNYPSQITRKFQKPAQGLSKSDPSPAVKPVKAGPDTGDRLATAFIGAAVLGGSAAMGAFYPEASGVLGAAGLSGLAGAVVGAKTGHFENFAAGGVVATIVGTLSAIGGQAMGPSFAVVAGAVGGGLGFLISGK